MSFLPDYVVPAVERVGAELMEFAAPEIADAVCGRKTSKTAAKSVRRQTLREHLVCGSRKMSASKIIPTKYVEETI